MALPRLGETLEYRLRRLEVIVRELVASLGEHKLTIDDIEDGEMYKKVRADQCDEIGRIVRLYNPVSGEDIPVEALAELTKLGSGKPVSALHDEDVNEERSFVTSRAVDDDKNVNLSSGGVINRAFFKGSLPPNGGFEAVDAKTGEILDWTIQGNVTSETTSANVASGRRSIKVTA